MAEAGAGRQSLGRTGNPAIHFFEQVVEIGGRSFTFHVGTCCQNDFAIRLPGDAFHQGLNIEVFRLHIIQRGKLAAQTVVPKV